MTFFAHSFLACFLLAAALASPAIAGPTEDTEAAYAADQKGDFAIAMKLYQSAVRGGVVYAMHNIGVMYFEGKGVDVSYVKALEWYHQAADKGYPDSQNAIGGIYERGESVKRSTEEAVKWYRLAADQGFLASQNSLGVIYASGDGGVAADLVQAHLWFSLAAKEDASAASRRDRMAARMTPQQIAEAEKLARNWKPK